MQLAIDAMGGDHAPRSVVDGLEIAARKLSGLHFHLYGDEAIVAPLLAAHPELRGHCTLHHCESIIGPHMKPSQAVRQGKGSSMWHAIQAVKDGQADAVISAGNTGALMAISKLVLKTLPGINRPAIVSLVPTLKGRAVMLDLGANVHCSGEDLFQFAIMGDAFARSVLNLKRPKIGLLNIGSEEIKGNDELKDAYALLSKTPDAIDFHGFIEGNDIGAGTVDVVVADGFAGNVALKTAEGTAKLIREFVREAFAGSVMGKLAYLLGKPAFKALRKKLDHRKYNGAMFVGLNGVTVKSHGSADGYGIYHAIKVAAELVEHKINERILDELRLSLHTLPVDQAEPAAEVA